MTPTQIAESMAAAGLAHEQGRWEECKTICQDVLAKAPKHIPALILFGLVLVNGGAAEDAVPYFQTAIEADPGCAPAYFWLSVAFGKLGRNHEALARARDAVARNPKDPLIRNHMGHCLLELKDFKEAEGCFKQVLVQAPNVPVVHYEYGLALQGLHRNVDAIAAFRRSAKLNPSSAATQIALRKALLDEGDATAATQAARVVVDLEPNSAEANLWLAFSLMEDNRAQEAEPYLQRAVQLSPESAEAHSLIGSIMQFKGRRDEADFHFRKSIELVPKQGSSYLSLTSNGKVTERDRGLVDQMKRIALDPDLPIGQANQLHYALGKAFEDLGDFEEAMEHFDQANRISYLVKFGDTPYDPKPQEAYDRMARHFTSDFIQGRRDVGLTTDLPVFVVGMLRSGTTLIEQILSSHPVVGAAGEQRYWLEYGSAAMKVGGDDIDSAILTRLADKYVDRLRSLAPGKSRVVDKLPTNYQTLGLIHVAFPNAKIIHVQRHPVDTCISVYTTPMSNRLGWAHDKGQIVQTYERYLRLMDHWRAALPSGSMMDVKYEDVVEQSEPTIRSMVEFCGLEWDDACLSPEQNSRSVVTPSLWQVRQPIYKSSMGRWKKYQPWLGPLAKLMLPQ